MVRWLAELTVDWTECPSAELTVDSTVDWTVETMDQYLVATKESVKADYWEQQMVATMAC